MAADFRADEASGEADAPLTIAGEGHLREEPTGVRSPVRTDEGALVRAAPRQAHDVDAAAHRPRARSGRQADVSALDDARDAVLGKDVAGSEPGASTRTRPALTWTHAPSQPT